MVKFKSGAQLTCALLMASVSAFGLATAAQAQSADAAQDAPVAGVAEVVVTAQKRSTSLQRTPLAVTALSAEALQQAQVNELSDINGLVPSLKFGDRSGYAQITIRGIGINNFVPLAESAVALNLNEVYISRPVAFLGGLYDIGGMEVLRGPQGTLYGRNATAGALNLTTTRPTNEFSGYATATIGNYGQIRFEGAVGGALVEDKVLLRVAGFREKRDGYGENIVTGDDIDNKDAYGLRGTLVLKPTDNLRATLVAEYYEEDDNGGGSHFAGVPVGAAGLPIFMQLGGRPPADRRDLANRLDPIFKLDTTAITGIVEWDNGPVRLKSITGYRDQDFVGRVNFAGGSDPGGAYLITGEPAHQFSQELQASYETDRFNITAGAYYFREHDDFAPGVIVVDNAVFRAPAGYTRALEIGGLQKVRAKAVFGEATFNVTDQLSLTAGIRYSSERKRLYNRFLADFVSPYTGDFLSSAAPAATALTPRTFKSTTPRFGIQYQIDPKTLLYATYAEGFKSGGFAASAFDALAQAGFKPEKVKDYEAGLKTTILDNRLRLNFAGFYYDYADLQVQQIAGPVLITANAASASIYGAEVEFTAVVTPALTIDGYVSWLHARYDDYIGPSDLPPYPNAANFSGNRLNNSPDFQGFVGATYRWNLAEGELALRGDVDYSSKFYFSPTNTLAAGQEAFAKVNASLTYTSNSGWRVRAFVRNITDETTRTSSVISHASFVGEIINDTLAPPRTYGLELGYSF